MLSDVSDLFDSAYAPITADRRLTRRFVDMWARTARGRFPSWQEFQSNQLGDDWDWVFAVDVEKSVGFPYFIFLGQALTRLSDIYLTGDDDFSATLFEKAVDGIFGAVAEEGPHYRDDRLTLCDGRSLMLRAVTLPLSEDGTTITHVMGAVNGKLAPIEPAQDQ